VALGAAELLARFRFPSVCVGEGDLWATIVLSAGVRRAGGAIGGGAWELTLAAVDRARGGATLGRVIDARLMGAGLTMSRQGRVDRFRLRGAGEGDAGARCGGGMRPWRSGDLGPRGFWERSSTQCGGCG